MSKYDKHVVGVEDSILKLKVANFLIGSGILCLIFVGIYIYGNPSASFEQIIAHCWIALLGIMCLPLGVSAYKSMKKDKSNDIPLETIATSNAGNAKINNSSIADELLKLAELKEKGILTEKEFQEQKNRLLSK